MEDVASSIITEHSTFPTHQTSTPKFPTGNIFIESEITRIEEITSTNVARTFDKELEIEPMIATSTSVGTSSITASSKPHDLAPKIKLKRCQELSPFSRTLF